MRKSLATQGQLLPTFFLLTHQVLIRILSLYEGSYLFTFGYSADVYVKDARRVDSRVDYG